MNRIHYFIMFCLLLSACGKEESLTPSGERDDYFTVTPDNTAEDAELRRDFYNEHHVHLLFNDTLRHEQRGFYANGTPRWYTETIDFAYALTSNNSATWQIELLNNLTDKKTAAELVEEYILPHLGQAIRPYSFLLVNNFEQWNSRYEEWEPLNFYNGYRCLVVNTGSLLESNDKENACMEILKNMLTSKLNDASSAVLKPFKTVSQKYYDAYANWDGYELFYDDFEEWQDQNDIFYYACSDAEDAYSDAEDAYYEALDQFDNGEINEEELAEYEDAMNEAEDEMNRNQEEYDEFKVEYKAYLKRIAHESGFIWFNSYGSIRPESYDLKDYINAIFQTPEQEFMDTYAEYPLVCQKYTTLKGIITDMGFVF